MFLLPRKPVPHQPSQRVLSAGGWLWCIFALKLLPAPHYFIPAPSAVLMLRSLNASKRGPSVMAPKIPIIPHHTDLVITVYRLSSQRMLAASVGLPRGRWSCLGHCPSAPPPLSPEQVSSQGSGWTVPGTRPPGSHAGGRIQLRRSPLASHCYRQRFTCVAFHN